jgi:hypothetical protein
MGKALKSIAFWKLEKGSRAGLIDQLLGSTTIFQTIVIQTQLRAPGIVGITLVFIWALSPLGGQATLRTLGHKLQYTTTRSVIQ